MSRILDKFRDFVGLNENIEEGEEYDYIAEEQPNESVTQQPSEEKVTEVKEEYNPYRRRYQETLTKGRDTVIGSSSTNNVIGMPGLTQSTSEVVVIEPHSFSEICKVIDILKERRSVVLNLNVIDPEEAQRAVDFVAGGTYAIDGHQERIGESIFLFTPSCVKVSTMSGMAKEVAKTEQPEPPKVASIDTHPTFERKTTWPN